MHLAGAFYISSGMMKSMTTSRIQKIISLAVLYGALALFFMLTDPLHLPLPLLIVPYVLIFLGMYWPLRWWFRSRRPLDGGKDRRHSLMAAVLAAYLPLLLILGSLNQLTLRDAVLLAVLTVGGTFYVGRLS